MQSKRFLLFIYTIIMLFSFTSCEGEEEGKLIVEDSSFTNSYEIYEREASNTTNGFTFTASYKGFAYKSIDLSALSVVLLKTNKTHLTVPDILKDKRFDFYYKDFLMSANDQKELKRDILKAFLDHYNLKLEENTQKESVKELYIEDEEKLSQLVTRHKRHQSINVEVEKPSLTYYDLDLLASFLTSKFEQTIVYEGGSDQKYDLEISKSSLEDNVSLFKKYGLAFRDIEKDITQYIIVAN